MSKITLESTDGKCFTVDVEIAKHFRMIRTMLDNLGTSDLEDNKYKLQHVDGRILEKIIEWATHHKDDPPFEGSAEDIRTDVSKWDYNFIEANGDEVLKITEAANYLDIPLLLNACSKYIANEIKWKSIKQIRERFNILPPPIEKEQSSQTDTTDALMKAEEQEKKVEQRKE